MSRPYLVTWEIEVYADDPVAAAQRAFEIHRDPESIANVFDVTPVREEIEGECTVFVNDGETVRVDLEEDPPLVTPMSELVERGEA